MRLRPKFWYLIVFVWFAVLYYLSSQSHLTPPGPDFENKDKVLHAGYYALGGACLFAALRLAHPSRQTWVLAVTVLVFCSAVGVFDEWHQSHVPNRSGNDPYDWMADTLGGILATPVGLGLLRVLRAKRS